MKKKEWMRDIALQRMERLFELAEANAKKTREKVRSNRYTQLARRIGMRYRVRMPKQLRIRICKGCHSFLIPGRNARIRLRGNYITTTCLECNRKIRRPYKAPHPPSPRINYIC